MKVKRLNDETVTLGSVKPGEVFISDQQNNEPYLVAEVRLPATVDLSELFGTPAKWPEGAMVVAVRLRDSRITALPAVLVGNIIRGAFVEGAE